MPDWRHWIAEFGHWLLTVFIVVLVVFAVLVIISVNVWAYQAHGAEWLMITLPISAGLIIGTLIWWDNQ